MAKDSKAADAAKEKLGDGVEYAKEKLGEGVEYAKERLGEVAKDVEKRYQKVAEEMRKEAEKAKEKAKERMDVAVEGLRTGYDKVRKDVGELTDDFNDYVRDNPGKAVLIAAAVGFVVGLLIRSSDRD
jgi:ElaB/YqjD/DUF883 family membrane-anchored ribosome-binding protein